MARYALVDPDSKVDNFIEVVPDNICVAEEGHTVMVVETEHEAYCTKYHVSTGYSLVPSEDKGSPGDSWDGSKFIAVEPSVAVDTAAVQKAQDDADIAAMLEEWRAKQP